MITFSAFDVVTLEHTLRVDKVNRDGWLREAASGRRRANGLGTVLIAMVASIFRTSRDRAPEAASASGAAAASAGHVQGAA